MDLAGIGAIAAAGVALVGVSGALLVGRWQMKAAMQQAQKTYDAAVDAVRSSAVEARAQWVREIRRESYSAFLLAMDTTQTAIEEVPTEHGPPSEEIAAARKGALIALAALRRQFAIIQIEGPDPVAESASNIVDTLNKYLRRSDRLRAVGRHQAKIEAAYRHADDSFDRNSPPLRLRTVHEMVMQRPHYRQGWETLREITRTEFPQILQWEIQQYQNLLHQNLNQSEVVTELTTRRTSFLTAARAALHDA